MTAQEIRPTSAARVTISEAERAEIDHALLAGELPPHTLRRFEIVRDVSDGYTFREIATRLKTNYKRVIEAVRAYRAQGLSGLLPRRRGRPLITVSEVAITAVKEALSRETRPGLRGLRATTGVPFRKLIEMYRSVQWKDPRGGNVRSINLSGPDMIAIRGALRNPKLPQYVKTRLRIVLELSVPGTLGTLVAKKLKVSQKTVYKCITAFHAGGLDLVVGFEHAKGRPSLDPGVRRAIEEKLRSDNRPSDYALVKEFGVSSRTVQRIAACLRGG